MKKKREKGGDEEGERSFSFKGSGEGESDEEGERRAEERKWKRSPF